MKGQVASVTWPFLFCRYDEKNRLVSVTDAIKELVPLERHHRNEQRAVDS